MSSSRRPLLVLLLILLALPVVKATLNLTLQYELREDRPPGTAIGNLRQLFRFFNAGRFLAVLFCDAQMCTEH